jgi:poly(A) polymerase
LGIKHKSLKNIVLEKISADHYKIRAKDFSPAAVEITLELQRAGYQAYIVGGGVRDLLLGAHPKDFDVASDATPEEIKRLFRRCFIVGRRFRLAHVHLKNEVIEVATFRAEHSKGSSTHGKTKNGMIVRDNIYGDLEEDALRRDFTANALYYNPADNTIFDYTGGLKDLEAKQLRMIGDPKLRYQEDPVRILRALRLAGKLNLEIETETAAPIHKMSSLLTKVPSARLADELTKMFLNHNAWGCFQILQKYELLKKLLPFTYENLKIYPHNLELIKLTLENTQNRLIAGKTANFHFIMASFLWGHLQEQNNLEFDIAIRKILQAQSSIILITRKLSEMIRDIWLLQQKLENPRPRSVPIIFNKKEFRAAYDFLLLRDKAEEPVKKQAEWWTNFIAAEEVEREKMIEKLHQPKKYKNKNLKK